MIAGAVLAGGRSMRFGSNKALAPFRGRRLADAHVSMLRDLGCDPVFLVANDLAPYEDAAATLIRDVAPREGPLGGIHAALLFSPAPWVLVRAVDMPLLVPGVFSALRARRERADAVVPMLGGFYEPLMALYHRRCLRAVARALEGEGRRIISFFEDVRVRTLPEEDWRPLDPEGLSFRNVNTPDDLSRLP